MAGVTDRRIVVIGAGVIGLTSAIALQDIDVNVEIISATPPLLTTSAVAAAIWYPYGAEYPRALRWAADSYSVFVEHAALGVGVAISSGRELFQGRAELPSWASIVGGVGLVPADEAPPGYGGALDFSVPIVAMPRYLEWLFERFLQRGGLFVERKVDSLTELSEAGRLIVNCTGLGAATLAGDTGMWPVRGQVVRIANPGLVTFTRDDGNLAGRTYIYPRGMDCILGGTADVGNYDLTPDEAVTERILRTCAQLEPIIADAVVLDVLVGLRPARKTVRLELEAGAYRGSPVIHNYGHGGAGVTLSWGCAAEVARLARQTWRTM
jgi:D-amino-acid oxidase